MGNELQDWYAQHGICVVCGQNSAAPHRKLCWECLDDRRERACKYRANMTEEQKQAARKKACERSKKQYAERKKAGRTRKSYVYDVSKKRRKKAHEKEARKWGFTKIYVWRRLSLCNLWQGC